MYPLGKIEEAEKRNSPVIRKKRENDKNKKSDERRIAYCSATKVFSECLETIPESSNWLIELHFLQRSLNACMQHIEQKLRNTSGLCAFPIFMRGLVQRLEGNVENSLASFEACHKKLPENPLFLKEIARSCFLLGQLQRAVGVYSEVTKFLPNDWSIHHCKALCYQRLNQFAAARELLKTGISKSKNEESLILLGEMYEAEADTKAAMEFYKAALTLSPENTNMLSTLGVHYLKAGMQQKAFEALGKALSFDPNHRRATFTASSIIQHHGDYEVALSKYKTASNVQTDSANLWSNIGMCFNGRKKFTAAISCLKRAHYLAPLNWRIAYNLGLVFLEAEQYASAFNYLSAAVNLSADSALVYLALADSFSVSLDHLDDAANASVAYEKSAKLDKTNKFIAYNCAAFAYRQNDFDKANCWLNAYYNRAQMQLEQGHLEDSAIELDRQAAALKELLACGNKSS